MRLKYFFIAFVISLPFWWGVNLLQENLEKFFYAQIGKPFEEMVIIQIPERVPKPLLELDAKSAISLRIDARGKERILFQKNPEEILPIASLTKLMTAVIVLDYNPPATRSAFPEGDEGAPENYDLENTWITISPEAANQKNVPVYGNLKAGERFNLKQLLDLMLIYSSNDAAFALAEFIETENFAPVGEHSSLGGFVEKMNEKAEELGLENTNFINPTGLDPENFHFSSESSVYFNYSTAKDLIKLAQYILKNHPLIFEISLKKGSYLVENGISDLILPENKMALGGKTGYTLKAGGSLIFLFQDEKENVFINVILGSESEEARIKEMQKLIDWILI
ncbi:MAG: serine hydrolase [Patescibacteria group bacterium]|nr:serine hydrolase [Patescibacteria group bacterium]